MKYYLCFLLSALLVSTPTIADNSNKKSESVQTEILMQTSRSWDGQEYKTYPSGTPELSILKITIPPHTQLAWHTHPMPNAGYVLSGELIAEKKATGEKQLKVAGDVLPEMVDELHRGYTQDKPVVLIVFYAGTKGMPFSKPE